MSKLGIKTGDGDMHAASLVGGEGLQVVRIARHQVIFGDDAHRVPQPSQHREAGPSDLQLLLNRLVTVGHAAAGEWGRSPTGFGKLLFQEFGGPFLDENLRFKVDQRIIETRGKRYAIWMRRVSGFLPSRGAVRHYGHSKRKK